MQDCLVRDTNQKILEHSEKSRINAEKLCRWYDEEGDKEKKEVYSSVANKLRDVYHAVSTVVNLNPVAVVFKDV
jgi:hypothetical protein